MKEAGSKSTREHGVSLRAEFVAMNMRLCGAGCGTPIWVGKNYCDRCQLEIDALDKMTFEAERRRIERREKVDRTCRNLLGAGLELWDHLRKVDWITVAILTGMSIAVSVCAFDFGKAFAEWLMAGGCR